jgi:hypothetical protein
MYRTLSLFALLAVFTLTVRADDENKKKRSLIGEPEEMFKKMDANTDGKVTRRSSRRVSSSWPRRSRNSRTRRTGSISSSIASLG